MSQKLFEFDKSFGKTIVGTDEAGRGPAAGGVFAAAVYFPDVTQALISDLSILNDSKKLSAKKRESIYDLILENSVNSIVCVEVEEIEKINILNSSLKAMKIACDNVIGKIDNEDLLVLVDGNRYIKSFKYPQQFVIKGDGKSASIAAASILAKVTRDRYMLDLHQKYPMYGWDKNAGYLTKAHLDAVDKYGLCEFHRPSFFKKYFARSEQLTLL